MIGAADTFRAAAVEQLERWGERAGVDVVKGPEGSDPGAVAFDAVARGRERGADVVIVDTAGRLHTQRDLMAELEKVRRVITKQMPDAPHETLMTVDATTGQNGVRQAKQFGEAVGVTGIILTKLDGTAKGGIALAIANELNIPVKLIGIGEQLEDLRPFDPDDFARGAADRLSAMRIAVVGTGAIGATFAAALERAGHELVLCARTPVERLTVERGRRAAAGALIAAGHRARGRPRRLGAARRQGPPDRRRRAVAGRAGRSGRRSWWRCRTASSTGRWSSRSPAAPPCCPRSSGCRPRWSRPAACASAARSS